MATTADLLTETFKPLCDSAIMDLAYEEWSNYRKKSSNRAEQPSTDLSDVFQSDLTGLRYAVLSSFLGILTVFQVDRQNCLKRLDSWPYQDAAVDAATLS